MRLFSEYNPISVFVYFSSIVVTAMFVQNPIIELISLAGAVMFCISVFRKIRLKTVCVWIMIFILITLVNPIFSRNGETVLFFINGRAVTLEALVYGADNALMILSVMIWFLSFSEIMTSDRIMYIFGRFSPRLGLFVSMSLRFIPLYRRRASEINNTQKAMGVYNSDTVIDDIKGGIKVMSSLITWSLETSVDTADSFRARGGELRGRSSFSLFKFRKADAVLIAVSVILFGFMFVVQGMGELSVDFYASGTLAEKLSVGSLTYAAYGTYFVLAIMPFVLEKGFAERF